MLLRCWGLVGATGLAVALGVVGAAFWDDDVGLPRLTVGVPMSVLFPMLTSALLTWPLVERWPAQQAVSPRPICMVPLCRVAATLALSALAALVAGAGSGPVVAQCLAGVGVAALVTPLLGRRTPLAMVVLGYLWLLVTVQHEVRFAGCAGQGVVIGLVVAGSAAHMLSAVRRAP